MIDGIVFPLIQTVYNLFVDIANTTIFTDDIINIFSKKVYALLGVFMLFKVSFSIMTYIINPDEFTDKAKGFTKMISNVVITLALLLLTPWIFTQAMDIQRIVLKDNIIGKIFSTSETSSVSTLNAGSTMAYETFKAFFYLDTEKYPDCVGIYSYKNGNQTVGAGEVTSCSSSFPNYSKYKDSFYIAEISKNIDVYMDYDLLNEKSNSNNYVMTYMPLISTLAGGFICWILIVFCFDIATRSIKLGFLRMIAPIPIISRVDPKKGKDVFNKWVKSCLSTYLDLFIRLLAIYFAIFVIGLVADMQFVDAVTGANSNTNAFVKVFIIMGALLFAKQLPHLLHELTGIQMDGKFTMNPLRKIAEVPIVGQGTSRVLGGIGSMATGNGFRAGWCEGGRSVPFRGGDGKQSVADTFRKYGLFGEDARKHREEREKSIREHNRGAKLLEDTLTEMKDKNGNVVRDSNGNPIMEVDKTKQYDIYGNQAYANSVKSVDDAKDRRNLLQSDYEQLKMKLETEGSSMDEDSRNKLIAAVDKARIASVKADSDYEKVKKAHQEIRKQNVRLAEIEDIFNSAKDEFEAKNNVSTYWSNYGNNSNAPTANTTSSNNSTVNSNTTVNNTTANSTNQNATVNSTNSYSGSYSQSNYSSVNDRTTMQERIENSVNYHEAPTREEHNERQDYYTRFVNDPAISSTIAAEEQIADSRSQTGNDYDFSTESKFATMNDTQFREQQRLASEQSEINKKMLARISKNNEIIAAYERAVRDPNVKIGDREKYFKELKRLKNENASLQSSVDEHTH